MRIRLDNGFNMNTTAFQTVAEPRQAIGIKKEDKEKRGKIVDEKATVFSCGH
jgi:hypothetical protein